MKYDTNGKQELHLAQAQTQRTLSNVATMFKLEDLDTASAVTLSERVAKQLEAMTPEGRHATLVSSALALAEIKKLCETLNAHLENVGGEIRRINSHNTAVAAYRRGRKAAIGSR